MGSFVVPVEVANVVNKEFQTVEALVDTGASYSKLPASLLEGMAIEPTGEEAFVLADGEVRTYAVGYALFRYGGKERPSTVIFGGEEVFLLGAITLQELGLSVDAYNERLVDTPELYLVGLRQGGSGS